jgi:hypothetical protein
LFYLKVKNMLKTTLSGRNVMSILSNCNVTCSQSGYCLAFKNSHEATGVDAAMTVVSEYCRGMYFEGRKRRPQERGRKKRRKGKWNPIDRLWSSVNHKKWSPMYLLEQN